MNPTVLLAVVRRDRLGRLYRVQPLDEAERLRIRKLTHAFYCRDRCSVRQTQRALAEQGARRATGTIWRDLSLFTCHLAGCPGSHPPGTDMGTDGPVPAGLLQLAAQRLAEDRRCGGPAGRQSRPCRTEQALCGPRGAGD